jgi:serine/threonine protein kinase
MELSAGDKLGPYEIIGLLGRGGMGEVYRTTDSRLRREVAIKVSGEQFSDRFLREARAVAALNHPNICTLYDVGPNYLVMELVDGPTLAERIQQGAIPMEEALTIARQIAEALDTAHEKGIVHRDLKPANVKLRSDGVVKVLDFGLAKRSVPSTSDDDVNASPTLSVSATKVGAIMGTAAYMAPEQARGRTVDKRVDIWAFGVLLYEMLTGQRLFEGESVSDVIAEVLKYEPNIDAIPAKLQPLVRRCLEKDPKKRLRDIGDAMSLLESAPSALASTAEARPTLRWPALAAMFAVGAALAVLATWFLLSKPEAPALVTRFSVDAPLGNAFNYTFTGTAISPDGRFIVFRAAKGTETPLLWLRPLDSLTARPIPGTESADFPFWSPDSKSIGFFSAGKMKRVDLSGGSPLTVCEASDADIATAGASWNRDGLIIFGGTDGLRRVAASGGVPALLSRVKAERKESGYGFPQFLPDGKRFLFFVRTEDRKTQGVYASSVEHPDEATLILASDHKAIYVPPSGRSQSGYLFYLREQTLMAQPFDSSALRLEGEPSPVAEEVALFPQLFHASFWVSDTGVLVYRTGASDTPKLSWLSREGKRLSEIVAEDFSSHVRVTPEGNKAVVEIADSATGNIDVWSWDFTRGVKTRRTFDTKPDRYPVWSPDGRQIAFSSARSGLFQIYRKDLERGGDEELLTSGPNPKYVSDWSRDGRFLFFSEIDPATAQDIWALPITEKGAKPIPLLKTPFLEANGVVSPDGKWFAYNSIDSGRWEVYVQPFPTAGGARWQVSTQGGRLPKWRGDGQELFFIGLDGSRVMAASVRTQGSGIESDTPKTLFRLPIMLEVPSPYDVTSDGQRFLLLERTISQATPLAVVLNWQESLRN